MGTRADFYVGRGPDAEWLGSIAWDGHQVAKAKVDDAEGIYHDLRACVHEPHWRDLVAELIAERDDGTHPVEHGWPWPWNDSGTTDFAYAFDDGRVWMSRFGRAWLPAIEDEPEEWPEQPEAVFPDMSARKDVVLGGPRSGVIVVSGEDPE